MGREWREQGRSASASSVRGPSDWSGVIRMHCEALNIRWTSRKRNGYYSKQKFSSMRVCEEVKKFDEFAAWDCNQEKKKCKKPLAPGKTCDRLAPICIPTFYFWKVGVLPSWGRLRNSLWRSRAMGLVLLIVIWLITFVSTYFFVAKTWWLPAGASAAAASID